ncbi:MAG: RIP metalloprotease RseP [Clostridiales bacterium]|nr:RIP metalloprotease RseP [Clostridiales bacterium]
MQLLSIIVGILVFSFLIFTHELGHFLFAKKGGIGVIEFSIGMGPRLFSRQIGETLYSIKCIPFGGSCMMVGEDCESEAENAFHKKSVWARILVVAGGPAFNLITAFILSMIIVAGVGYNPAQVYQVYPNYGAEKAGIEIGDIITSINGHKIHMGRDIDLYLLDSPLDGSDVTVSFKRDGAEQTVTYDPGYSTYRLGISYDANETAAVLSDIQENSAAYLGGLRDGDTILAVNGTEIGTGEELKQYFDQNPMDGSPVSLTCLRDGRELEMEITPTYYETSSLGFGASYLREKTNIIGVVRYGFQEVAYWVRYTIFSLKMLVTGKVGVNEMSGPVGIVSAIHDTVQSSSSDGIFYVIMNLLNLSVLLSANLGILNLLPIPALDGGRLVFLAVEAIRGKPVSPDREGQVHIIGFVLLMILMVFVMFNDILRLI